MGYRSWCWRAGLVELGDLCPHSPIGRGSGLKIRQVSVRVRLGAQASSLVVVFLGRYQRRPATAVRVSCQQRDSGAAVSRQMVVASRPSLRTVVRLAVGGRA